MNIPTVPLAMFLFESLAAVSDFLRKIASIFGSRSKLVIKGGRCGRVLL